MSFIILVDISIVLLCILTCASISDSFQALTNTHQAKDQTDSERAHLKGEIEKLQTKLETARDKHLEVQIKMNDYAEKAEKAERNAALQTQQLADTSGNLQNLGRSKVTQGSALCCVSLYCNGVC